MKICAVLWRICTIVARCFPACPTKHLSHTLDLTLLMIFSIICCEVILGLWKKFQVWWPYEMLILVTFLCQSSQPKHLTAEIQHSSRKIVYLLNCNVQKWKNNRELKLNVWPAACISYTIRTKMTTCSPPVAMLRSNCYHSSNANLRIEML